MGANGTTVILSALNGGAPTLSMTVAGREGGNSVAVDRDGLSVVTSGVIELVCKRLE